MNIKQRGIILLSTLAIMVVLSIFLMTTVYQIQSSVMATKRVIWDIKSYWATEAGNNFATDACISKGSFPINISGELNYENYKITNDNGVIRGKDDDLGSNFSIYTSDNSELNVSLRTHFNSTKNSTPTDEIYCLTVGQSGPAICATEFIYKINNDPNTTFGNTNSSTITREEAIFVGAALFVGGNLDVNVKDFFNILQKDGTRGCIVSGGAVNITSENNAEPPTWDKAGGLSIGDGVIFAKNSCNINGTSIPLGDDNNLSKYGVSVYQKPNGSINPPKFKNPENAVDLPSGIWAFMEMPTQDGLQKGEFEALCTSILESCPEPNQIDVEVNINDINQFDNKINALSLKNSNFDYKGCFDYYFDLAIKNFEEQNQVTIGTDKKESYKSYIKSKFNQICNKFDGSYKPFFIPDGSFGTRAKLTAASINSITYPQIMRSITYGELAENGTELEKETINTKISNLTAKTKKNLYISEKCSDSKGSDFYLINRFTTYNPNGSNIKSRIVNVGQNVSFSATNNKADYLTMEITGNLESKDSDSFFSFAVFERNPLNFSEEYKKYLQSAGEDEELYSSSAISQLISQQTECYVPANDRRGAVKLGNGNGSENSIIVNKMHIKGSIQGEGNLRAKAKDITFEGVGSGVTSGDNLVSMWAADDIKIYQVSAADSTDFLSNNNTKAPTAEFKGILYANDKIRINVGADNLNFNVSGVVISRTGLMEVNGIKNFTITYDPDLSGDIMEKYIDGWTTITDSLGSTAGNNPSNNNSTVRVGTFKAFNRI